MRSRGSRCAPASLSRDLLPDCVNPFSVAFFSFPRIAASANAFSRNLCVTRDPTPSRAPPNVPGFKYQPGDVASVPVNFTRLPFPRGNSFPGTRSPIEDDRSSQKRREKFWHVPWNGFIERASPISIDTPLRSLRCSDWFLVDRYLTTRGARDCIDRIYKSRNSVGVSLSAD